MSGPVKDWKAYIKARVLVDAQTGCWVWQMAKTHRGYGQFAYNGKCNMRAHRAAYEIFIGPLVSGLVIRHTCDNTSCVNPQHLVQGTYKQNTEDMLARNRGHKLVGASIGTAKLTETQVLEMRSLAGSLSMEKLAAKYGISDSGVWRIIHRETWKHI